MKRFRRTAAILTGALLALAVVSSFLVLDTVDHTPYFRTSYYEQTSARLRASAATNVIARGELHAGFGRAKLTPQIGAAQDDPQNGKFRSMPLAGYGDRRGRPATGVHDDLFVKAVALRVGDQLGVMFGADALIIPREVADLAAAELATQGLRREQLYFSATHTHCSLGGWGEGFVGEAFAGDFDPGARLWFAQCLVSAARAALGDLQPAEFGAGVFAAPDLVRNRLVGELGQIDPDFSYAVLKQAAGITAVLGSFSAHATVLSGRIMEFSGDYPGYWQRAVEAETGGLALFLAGCVGSHAPVPGESGFAGAERIGQELSNRLLAQLPQTALTNAIAFGLLGLDVSLPAFHTRVTDGIRLRPWLSARLLQQPRDSFLQGFRLDRSLWISTPCDFSGELALDIKAFTQLRGFTTAITSFNGDYIGYVIPSRYYHLPGYEPRLMSFYGPAIPEYLDELIRTVALDLTDGPID